MRMQLRGYLKGMPGTKIGKKVILNGEIHYGKDVTIHAGTHFTKDTGNGICRLKDNVEIGANCTIDTSGDICIGKNSFLSNDVKIFTHTHTTRTQKETDCVLIASGCWIGSGAILLPGVIIGRDSVVGAGSVVTKQFSENNCLICGNPARVVKRIGSCEEGYHLRRNLK